MNQLEYDLLKPHVRHFVDWKLGRVGFGKAIFDCFVDADRNHDPCTLDTYAACYEKEFDIYLESMKNSAKYKELVKKLEIKLEINLP